ncbi:type II toxin-antitoxin system RelB family antitoxin, partial [Neisseria viridiae]|uniref:type II toxin-antitoxin system RelB family antitoxin n=2 Tax=Neisseria TaxID=482 RepID=UPI00272D835B
SHCPETKRKEVKMTTAVLDYRLSEFDTVQEAEDYDTWLARKVEEARDAEIVSHEDAMAHFAAKRAERLKGLKNASAA